MKDTSNIFKLPPDALAAKHKDLWSDTAPEIEEFAKKIGTFLGKVDTPYVMGLEGGYGTGKTHFATRFAAEIQQDIRCLYFSSWEKDYIQEPLNVFIEQITWLVKNEKEIINDINRPLIQKLLRAWWETTELTLNLSVMNGSIRTTTNIKKFIRKVNELMLPSDILQKAKQSLADYIQLLPHQKLVFIIDDLDRCRPDNAVKTLEIIKHFFDIDGLIVIMPINKQRLSLYINAFYGIPYESQRQASSQEDYLQKFFNEIIDIPVLNYRKICQDKITKQDFTNNLIYEGNLYNSINELRIWMAEYAKKAGLSYRETQEAINKAKTFCNNYNEPIRCRLLAYTICNSMHKTKATRWNELHDLNYGENNIYSGQANPKYAAFHNRTVYSLLYAIYTNYTSGLPNYFYEKILRKADIVPEKYSTIYNQIDELALDVSELIKELQVRKPYKLDAILELLDKIVPALQIQKNELQDVQRIYGSDDHDAVRKADYEDKIKHPYDIGI